MDRLRQIFGGSRKEGQPQGSFANATSREADDPSKALLAMYAGQDPEVVKKQLARQFQSNSVKAEALLAQFVVNKYSKSDEPIGALRPGLEDLFNNNADLVTGLMDHITEAREKKTPAQP